MRTHIIHAMGAVAAAAALTAMGLAGAGKAGAAGLPDSAARPAHQVTAAYVANSGYNTVAAATTYYRIVNHDGLCLTIPGGSTSNGAHAAQKTCNSSFTSQDWVFISGVGPNSQLADLIQNRVSGKCLSILNNDPNPGGAVIQWTCNYSGSDASEDWIASLSGSGPYYAFYNIGTEWTCSGSNACAMHPDGNGTTSGLEIYVNSNNSNEYLWKPVSV